MDDEIRAWLTEFGRAVVEKEFDRAQACLAPWLAERVSIKEDIASTVEETREEREIIGEPHPAACDVGYNDLGLDELREDDTNIDTHVNEENFRQWCSVVFLASEEEAFDAYCDMWMIVVDTEGGLRIGYYELTDPD